MPIFNMWKKIKSFIKCTCIQYDIYTMYIAKSVFMFGGGGLHGLAINKKCVKE